MDKYLLQDKYITTACPFLLVFKTCREIGIIYFLKVPEVLMYGSDIRWTNWYIYIYEPKSGGPCFKQDTYYVILLQISPVQPKFQALETMQFLLAELDEP